MSDFFSLDSTDYPEYSNIIISFAQRSQENLPYQQFTDTGSLEYSNSKSLPLTPPEDQLILGESVNTSPLYSNNNSTDILNGEMRSYKIKSKVLLLNVHLVLLYIVVQLQAMVLIRL